MKHRKICRLYSKYEFVCKSKSRVSNDYRSEPLENKVIVEVSNIIHIQYVAILHMYIDSLFRITQYPDTTSISKDTIQDMCKIAEKIKTDVDVSHLQNEIHVLPELEEDGEEKYIQNMLKKSNHQTNCKKKTLLTITWKMRC